MKTATRVEPPTSAADAAMANLRYKIKNELTRRSTDIINLSHAIHADPELSGQEFRAARRAADVLANAGFTFESEQPRVPASFCARFGSGELVVVLCVEYDALPGIGHGCGHNVNAAAALGAALALTSVAHQAGLTIKVLGTPAEESIGGKAELLKQGFFDDAHLALMAHAAAEDTVGNTSLAMTEWEAVFEGLPAHAALAAHEGINALDAVVIAQTAIGLARQQLPGGSVVSLIVTEGGTAPNVIPSRARATLEMRAPTAAQLQTIQNTIARCLEAGAVATGSKLTITPSGNAYEELTQDPYLCEAYRAAMAELGRTVAVTTEATASTDMGNVSQVVPAIHPMIGYNVHGAVHHTAEFARYGTTPSADEAVLDAAYGLAAAATTAAITDRERKRLLQRTQPNHSQSRMAQETST
ncbi:amidohydrolase [Paenarthrobacter sp. NPDC089714]|uniref:amidohydrolase n=1 Tax=Paenarthrobacter sp. NPDC089714 TaxID=3364377 RepID=UPI00381E0EC2